MAAAGLLVLRVVLAFVLIAHGTHVLIGYGAGAGLGPGGLGATAARYAAQGLEPGGLIAVLVGVVQLLGGVLIGVGLLARWASAAAAVLLGLLLWKEQLQWGFYLNWAADPARGHGIEFSVVLIGGLVCILLAGPGDWSFDGRRAGRAASRAAGRARLHRRT